MKFASILGGLLALLAVSLLGPDRLAGGEETSHGLLAKKAFDARSFADHAE
jgi:hypothetical protein